MSQSPAGSVLKTLLIVCTVLCGAWLLFSLFLGTLRGEQPGEEAAYACMSIFGSATGLFAWFIGVVPFGILYAIFGPSSREPEPRYRTQQRGRRSTRRR